MANSPLHEQTPPNHPESYGTAYPQNYYGGYYGAGYGGYGTGPEHGGQGQPRSVQDYLIMVRERFWYLVLAVFVCVSSVIIYTANTTPEWMAAAKLQVYRTPVDLAPDAQRASSTSLDNVISNEDFMTQVEIMKSTAIMNKVSQRLSQEEKKRVLEPYQDGNILTGPLRDIDVIAKCYDVKPQRQTLIAYISYTHTDPDIATRLTDYFSDEIYKYNIDKRQNVVTPLIELMGVQIKQKQDEIEDMYKQKAALIQSEGILTLTTKMDTARSELSNLVQLRDNDRKNAEDAESLWKQMQSLKENGLPTTNMAAISSNERVSAMDAEVSKQSINVSGLKPRYTESHPRLIEAMQMLEQATKERAAAVAAAEAKIEQNYHSTQNSYKLSSERVKEKEAQIVALNSSVSELEMLEKKILDAEGLKSILVRNYETEKMKVSGAAAPTINILEKAFLTSNRPINKNYLKMGAVGFGVGILLGCGIIFILAFLDDRVKSAADIEGFLGLPLVGILPVARKLSSFQKARVVASGEDRPTVEGFRAIYSALKINEVARTAKTILTTSTTPSEGKSFVTTNLAMTFAMHGERVLVLDADLRMPAIGKTLELEGDKGITRYLQGGVSLEDSIYHDVVPNLDVMPVGASCKNPTQILNSRRFADMVSELKERYDRIFIDSPPVGAVSDSLNLLPQVDGVIYVVRFNTVKRCFIKSNLRRLQESKVPVFGAVLNQIGLKVARYYTNTGDKAYAKYYTASSPDSVEVKVS
ncbi:MAG: polysaccharide biosynthesis tyrosine autokinase [Puniceicoccales bacterium]|jgi:capsular exopolysaccharide synthesis family protein|nr:polysaccharide biosynthesis tyrosine autokinase [Puniceicoccales bacterium]